MKKLHLLKSLLDLFLFFLIIASIGMLVFIPIVFFSSEPIDIPVKINGTAITIIDLPSKIMIIVLEIAAIAFTYGVYLLRTLLTLFSKKIIFEEMPIALLEKIGKCFLISSLATGIPLALYNIFIRENVGIDFGGGFDSFLFTASLGLFFMVLSEVFKMAKSIKEENELTV